MPKILITTDGSDFSIRAAQRALALLGDGHDLTVLCVAPMPLGGTLLAGPEGAGFTPTAITTEEIEETIDREAHASAERTMNALGAAGASAAKRVERGDARLVICRVAEEEDFDLVVIGSHGSGLLKRVLLGSVSHHVLNHVRRPVLMVRLDEDRSEGGAGETSDSPDTSGGTG